MNRLNLRLMFAAYLLIFLSLAACEEEAFVDDSPTSIEGSNGEPVAINYTEPSSDIIHIVDNDEQILKKSLSTGYTDVWDGVVVTEAAIDLNKDYLIVGVGARVYSDDLTTLRVQARQHMTDGTLGSIQEFRAGTAPNNPLEVWCAAPIGHVIVGVAGRVRSDNMTTLQIWTRGYNATTRTLGPVDPDPKRCGTVPSATLERRIVTWEHASNEDVDRTVWNGIAMRVANDNLTSLRARLRIIQ